MKRGDDRRSCDCIILEEVSKCQSKDDEHGACAY